MNLNINEYTLVDIISVVNTGIEIPMNDIQVEDNETFFIANGTTGGIISHNSAISSFTEIRNPETQAGLPLRGKVLNVYGKAPIDAMENAEVADIITAINLEFNEQMGDWIYPENVATYKVTYESIFEVNKDGSSVVKQVMVAGSDKFLLSKRWKTVQELFDHPELYRGYIHSIEHEDIPTNTLSQPDYFHFRRSWDFRGFRKYGAPYRIKIGNQELICTDLDSVKIDDKWVKIPVILKKNPAPTKVSIEAIPSGETYRPTLSHKWLKPDFNSALRFSKIYIATDADPDGSSINNLLVNLFHEYFPELFWNKELPFVNRITFPMISAAKGKKTKYYENRQLFDSAKQSGEVDDTYKVTYFKGLGSMEKDDWEHVFDDLDKYSVKITDDGHLDELMQIFFDSDASVRKVWLACN